jgi:hypothetical protein
MNWWRKSMYILAVGELIVIGGMGGTVPDQL